MTILQLFPERVRVVDADGIASPEFLRALRTLFERVGGPTAASNTDLAVSDDDDSGLEEFKAEAMKTMDGLAMVPPFSVPVAEEVLAEVAALREQVAVLQRQIDDISQGSTFGRSN